MQIRDFIICEDIRREIGDKPSLMGIFVDAINININGPVPDSITLALCIFFRLVLEEGEEKPDRIVLQIDCDGGTLHKINMEVRETETKKILTFQLMRIPLKFEKSCQLQLGITAFNDDKTVYQTELPYPLKVSLNSTESPQ